MAKYVLEILCLAKYSSGFIGEALLETSRRVTWLESLLSLLDGVLKKKEELALPIGVEEWTGPFMEVVSEEMYRSNAIFRAEFHKKMYNLQRT